MVAVWQTDIVSAARPAAEQNVDRIAGERHTLPPAVRQALTAAANALLVVVAFLQGALEKLFEKLVEGAVGGRHWGRTRDLSARPAG